MAVWRKHTKIPDLVRAVDMTYSARLQVQGNYIFGDPAESADSATETFSLWLKQRKVGINMIPIEVYPGTPLYKGAVKNGLIPDPTTYISGGCRSLNLMKMPERDALQLMLLMYLLVNTYGRVPGRILDCQPGQLVGNKDGEQTQLFNLKVHCPHCEKEVAYRDMPMYAAQRWVCPECNRRYDLQPLCQWRQAPASYELFDDFQFEEAHAAEMRRFLRQENWRDTRANMPGFLGVRLFGVHYLLPSNLTLDHIRYSMMRVFVADVEQKRLDPLVVCDCDYSNLHHPYYLTHRVAKLVEQWQGRNCTVAVAGAGAETSNLLKMTNLSQSRLTGFLPLEANDTAISGLGHPVLNLKRMVDNPPNVLLVSTVRNQRAFCEFFAGTLTRLGVEVVALYESGSHY